MSNKKSNQEGKINVSSVKTEDWKRLQKEHPAFPPDDEWRESINVLNKNISNSSDDERDNINPDHYKKDIECIDAMVSAFGRQKVKVWTELSAFKYIFRMDSKHESSLEDKQKAIWCLRYSIGEDPRKRGDY